MNEDNTFIEIEGRNKIKVKLNEIIDPLNVGPSNPIYYLKYIRVKEKRAIIELVNGFNGVVLNDTDDFLFGSKGQMRINTYRKKDGGIFETVLDVIVDTNLNTEENIKRRLNRAMVIAKQQWKEEQFLDDAEVPILEDESKFFPDRIMEEAERILSAGCPIDEVEKILDLLIAGEKDNKLFVFTLSLTGKCDDPTKKIIVCAKQEAGAGKSWILQTIVACYKSHTVSHLTKRALNYMGKHLGECEILFIKELGNLDRESDTSGNASIKMLSVDDGGLSTTYTLKDPDTGKFTTETVTTDPITVFTSTTRKDIDPQFVRRYWIFSPDGSQEQTIEIEKFKIRKNNQESDVMLGLRNYTDFDYGTEVLRCLVSLIKDEKILIPFYGNIFSILDNRTLRIRGDYDKIKLLLEMHGILNIRNLQKITMEVGGQTEQIYILTPERAIEILRIARTPLIYMSKDIEGRDIELVNAFKLMKIVPSTDEKSGTRIDTIKQTEIARRVNRKRNTILNWMIEFYRRGYLLRVNDRPIVYELAMSIEEIEEDMSGYKNLSDPELREELRLAMIEEGNKFFKDRNINFQFDNPNLAKII